MLSGDIDCRDTGEALPTMPVGDCNDTNKLINPGATETPADGVDQNCDLGEACWTDTDGDGYHSTSSILSADLDCTDPGEVDNSMAGGDCDDVDPLRHPMAVEAVGDEFDQDCDSKEVCYRDGDNDLYRTGLTLV